jgi:hypothetical protein
VYIIDLGQEKLELSHDAGFFSVLTVRLEGLLAYYRATGSFPKIISTKRSFNWYKTDDEDFASYIFSNDKKSISSAINSDPRFTLANSDPQFTDYSKLRYQDLTPIIKKYFNPAPHVSRIKQSIIETLNCHSNRTLGVVYRGTDKAMETKQPSFDKFLEMIEYVTNEKNIDQIFIETDEIEFLSLAQSKFTGKRVCFLNRDRKRNYDNIFIYFATILALSELANVVTTSGNGEMWIRLFRGNSHGTVQYLEPAKSIWGKDNPDFNPDQTFYWHGEKDLLSP